MFRVTGDLQSPTYCRSTPFSSCKVCKSWATSSPKRVGKFLKPYGNTVQQHCVLTSESALAIQTQTALVTVGLKAYRKRHLSNPAHYIVRGSPGNANQQGVQIRYSRVNSLHCFITCSLSLGRQVSPRFKFLNRQDSGVTW